MDPPLDPQDFHAGPSDESLELSVAYVNCVGQTKFPISKQLEIQSFVCSNNIDILHMQECKIDDDAFSQCGFITSNFNIFSNNTPNGTFYGTATMVRSDIEVSNIHTDNEGRIIVLDAAECTWANLYLPSGSDGRSKTKRENYFAEIIPQLLARKLKQGAAGGDFNSIVRHIDSNKSPESRVSPACKSLVAAFEWTDSYRDIYPTTLQYSRHMTHAHHGHGATRLDRAYHWGEIKVNQVDYLSISFSDHLSLVTKYKLPKSLQRHLAPRNRPAFKISPSVVKDELFNQRLKTSMTEWIRVLDSGVEMLTWWEILVKKGIKQLAMTRSREIKKQTIGRLNILKLRQVNLTHKVNTGLIQFLAELKMVNILISEWYQNESNNIIVLSRSNDMNLNEKVRVYHHGQHLQFRKGPLSSNSRPPKGSYQDMLTVRKHSRTTFSIT